MSAENMLNILEGPEFSVSVAMVMEYIAGKRVTPLFPVLPPLETQVFLSAACLLAVLSGASRNWPADGGCPASCREVREPHQGPHRREALPVRRLPPALLHQVQPDRPQEEAQRRRPLPEQGAQVSLLQQAARQQEDAGQTRPQVHRPHTLLTSDPCRQGVRFQGLNRDDAKLEAKGFYAFLNSSYASSWSFCMS